MFTVTPWKISRSLFVSGVNHDIRSPPFAFAGATWILHVWQNGSIHSNRNEWIDLGIERLQSRTPEHNVFYKFCLKTYQGKECKPLQGSFIFNAVNAVKRVHYAEKTVLHHIEKTVVKDDYLTIVCQMRTLKISGFEVFTPVEVFEPAARSSEENSVPVSGLSASISNGTSKEKSESDPKSSACVCKGCDGTSHPLMPLHVEKILQDFKELFHNKEDCDVTINVQGREFPAHKTILRARSPVLASAFRHNMKEKATNVIDIKDCDPSSFSDFLSFLYYGNLSTITAENVFSLFTTADKYDVQDLRSHCLAFMKENLSVDTFVDAVIMALQHEDKDLVELTTDFFAKNQLDIIVTDKWKSFLVANPIQSNEIVIKALASSKK